MKKLFFTFLTLCMALSIQAQEKKAYYYGKKIDASNARPANAVPRLLANKDTIPVKVEGKILDVCQKKGCWMMMETTQGEKMRIRFKDYDFFVPKDCAGKTAVIDGIAYNDVTSVEDLRHYAADAKKSKEEIEKITEPEKSAAFEAEGVIIYE